MITRPSVTVAAVIERGGQFLLVEEEDSGQILFNQPAGHLELGESLVEGCAREVLEESAWHFRPRQLIGIYRWSKPGYGSNAGVTYLRFAFCGELGEHEAGRIRVRETQRVYAVDSWFFDNGQPAAVLPVEDWLAGKTPRVQ